MNAKSLAVATILGLSAVVAQAAPIIVTVPNGNFEITSPVGGSGWQEVGVWTDSSPTQYRTQTSYSVLTGTNGARMVNLGTASVYQTLSVPAVANATYTLTFDVGRPNSETGGQVQALLYDGAVGSSTIINQTKTQINWEASPTWETFTVTGTTGATVSGNNISIKFVGVSGGQNGAGDWLDNVSLSYVPEPTSIMTASIGSLLMLRRRRRA